MRIALVAVLVACGGSSSPKEKGRASECFAYVMPGGWASSPPKTNVDLVLMGPEEFPLGDKAMHDTFTVRYISYPGSLETFKIGLLASITKANVDTVAADEAKHNPAIGSIQSGAPESTVTATTLGGREAFKMENRNTITVDGTKIVMVNTTVFAKFGDEIVDVAAGYLSTREAQVKPLAAAFLASVNFGRCK